LCKYLRKRKPLRIRIWTFTNKRTDDNHWTLFFLEKV